MTQHQDAERTFWTPRRRFAIEVAMWVFVFAMLGFALAGIWFGWAPLTKAMASLAVVSIMAAGLLV